MSKQNYEAGRQPEMKMQPELQLPLDSNQIMEILPHRYPMLLVDRIDELEPGVRAKGVKCITANEQIFCGHFPQQHIFPGVLILEALAQVGAVAILAEPEYRGKIAVFGGVKNARFRKQVKPGDVLELSCQLTARKGPVGMGTAEARVNGKVAASAELTFAVT